MKVSTLQSHDSLPCIQEEFGHYSSEVPEGISGKV